MKSKYGLTSRQREVLDFITKFVNENGHSPSFSEIADGLDIKSKSNVHGFVHRLEERGHLKIIPKLQRSIDVS